MGVGSHVSGGSGLWVVAWSRGTRGSAVVSPRRAGLEGKVGLPIVAWGSGIPPKGQKGEQSLGWAEGLGRESRGLRVFGKGQ